MASISSLTGSNSSSSSIYGTRNVISGLASGMDTESLIENAVSGYKTKITQLEQKSTKVEWQQEAFRSIIDKMSSFTDKYTSYQSSTNLMSASFFNNSTTVSTNGSYQDKIIASGKTSSNVQVLGVKQMAKAATYTSNGIGGATSASSAITGTQVDLSGTRQLSNVSGGFTVKYGDDRSFKISFGETDVFADGNEMAEAIEKKLEDQNMTLSDGTTVKASDRIGVRYSGGSIEFYDKADAGNSVYVSGLSGDLKTNTTLPEGDKPSSIDISGTALSKTINNGEYMQGKELSFTLDGVTKKITVPSDYTSGEDFLKKIQDQLDSSFGAGKITLDTNAASGSSVSLNFSVKTGSTLSVGGSAAELLGLDSTSTTYVNTSKSIGELLSDEAFEGLTPTTNDKGETVYELKINDKVVGSFTKDATLESVMTKINSNPDVGVTVSFSKLTNQFSFTTKETGAGSMIKMEADNLAGKLFGPANAQNGQDAIVSLEVNGQVLDGITRSSNVIDVDGMSVTLKGTFGEYDDDDNTLTDVEAARKDAVSFTTSADTDKIMDAIKSMIKDYNEMATEIKKAYSTVSLQKSNGDSYEPLTSEDQEGMSESAIKAYEEKAKTGLLFADKDLSSLYSRLVNAISMNGSDSAILKSIGITTSYSSGLTTLTLDETKLKSALESDPDKVRDIFTKSMDSGSSSDGLMQALKKPLEMYGKTTGTKGILVQKAGSTLAPTTLYQNTLQTQLSKLQDQISKWQDKMNDQIDRYTKQFTQLETLINQMNSQSSALSSFGGGY